MIAINTGLLSQIKTESEILSELSTIANDLADSEEYSGLKRIVSRVKEHTVSLNKFIKELDNDIKRTLMESASVNSAPAPVATSRAAAKPAPKKAAKTAMKVTKPVKENKGDAEA